MSPRAIGERAAARPWPWLAAILVSGLALRLALAPFGGYRYDVVQMSEWAVRLATVPLAEFYDITAVNDPVDHLPGDLWFLWLVAKLYQLYSPEVRVETTAFLVLFKLVPALADAGIGVLLYALGRHLAGTPAGLLAAALFTFNPGSLFVTSVWGQWDSLAACLALLSLWLLLRGQPEWAAPVLTYAALVKPPTAALAPLFALVFLRRYLLPHFHRRAGEAAERPVEPPSRSLRRALVAVAASLLVLVVVPLPFDVGFAPVPARWNLVDRLGEALQAHTTTSHSAFNLWTTPLVGDVAPRSGVDARSSSLLFQRPDTQLWLLGLSYQTWGVLLFVAVYGAIVATCWGRFSDRTLLWACLVIACAVFALLTRGHERYLFPAIVYAALAAALAPRLRWFYAALSLTFLANLYYVYARFYMPPTWRPAALYSSPLFVYAVSLLNLGLLLYVGLRALPLLTASPDQEADGGDGNGAADAPRRAPAASHSPRRREPAMAARDRPPTP